jgi:penicillin-binding protein 2
MASGVELRDLQRELYYFQLRLAIAAVAMLALFFALFVRFFYVQVVQHDVYHTLAEQNRIATIPVIPNRGLILDRNGVVLAHNFAAYTLEITPAKVGDLESLINELALLVEINAKDRKRFKKLLEEGHDFASLPIRTRLNDREVARLAANRYRFPGVEINARLFRHYPNSQLAAHVVGYIGRLSEGEISTLENEDRAGNYSSSDFIGKTGLEKRYEQELHGVTGFEQVETDASGRAVRTLRSQLPVSGNNLLLALDAKVQEVAERVFANHRGALVAIEPSTGGVLALVSRPGFDPNMFVDGIDSQNWDQLNNSPDHPLNNRALQGVYPPGSTFKPFMALASLELAKRNPSHAIHDPGYFVLGGSGHAFRDWKAGGHGWVDLHKAIVVSCDTYFYGLAQELGIDAIHDFMTQLGFGRETGIDVDGEAVGLLPSQEWKQRRFQQKWFVGDTISVGIGQGYNLATPMQLAIATATLANHGVMFRPHLVRHIQNNQSGELRSVELRPRASLSFKEENLLRIRQAMIDVTRPGGTAAWAGLNSKYLFAGKTGTAQVFGLKQGERYDEKRVNERMRDHALFIAFAPADDPKIALAVLVENGGHGATTAAPIARQVIDYFLLGKEPVLPKTPAVSDDD